MNDKEIIETVIAAYKSLPRREKGLAPHFVADAVSNYKLGRTKGMGVKTLVTLADLAGLEIVVKEK